MTTTTTERCFVIHGADYTRLARDFMMSDRPAQAYRLIANYLVGGPDGMAQKIAPEILDGQKKLVGSSTKGITVSKDKASGYKKQLRFIYAGRIRIGTTWWRPLAKVALYGPFDARYANAEYGPCPANDRRGKSEWCRMRAQYYAQGKYKLVDVTGDKSKNEPPYIIFEPCGELPFWWPEHTSADAALADFLASGRVLDEIRAEQDEDGIREHRARLAREAAECDRELEEEEYKAREKAWKARLAQIGEAVRVQANGDMIELTLTAPDREADPDADNGPYPRPLLVPRAPFVNWAIGNTSLRHLAPKWACISESGMKQLNDNPYHTDWMLGAGLELAWTWQSPVMMAASIRMSELQSELGGFEATVLSGGQDFEGIVGTADNIGAIVVLKDLRNSEENNRAIANARCVITENGGELAHLAIVGREMGVPVLLVPNARERFPVGSRLHVQPDVGKIDVYCIHQGLFYQTRPVDPEE